MTPALSEGDSHKLLECIQVLPSLLQFLDCPTFLNVTFSPTSPSPLKYTSTKPKALSKTSTTKSYVETKVKPSPSEDFSDIATQLKQDFPQEKWHFSPPSVSHSSPTKPLCYILVNPQESQDPFFQNLNHTLSYYFQAALVSKLPKSASPSLCLISHSLCDKPISKDSVSVFLKAPQFYHNNPKEKIALWHQLKPHLNAFL